MSFEAEGEIICSCPSHLKRNGGDAEHWYGVYCTRCWGWHSTKVQGALGVYRNIRPRKPHPNMLSTKH